MGLYRDSFTVSLRHTKFCWYWCSETGPARGLCSVDLCAQVTSLHVLATTGVRRSSRSPFGGSWHETGAALSVHFVVTVRRCLTGVSSSSEPQISRAAGSSKSVSLKLGAAKGCQGFRETKTRNGGRVLLAVRNLSVRVWMKDRF